MKTRKYKNLMAVAAFILLAASVKSQGSYYYGLFKIRKIMTQYDSVARFINYLPYATMYQDSVDYEHSWEAQNLANVYYNGKSLNFAPEINMFLDTNERVTNPGATWEIVNAVSVDDFTVTIDTTFPTIPKINLLPDQFDKNHDYRLILDGIENADEVELNMFDGQFRLVLPYCRKIPVGPPGTPVDITIPVTDMVSLDDGGQGLDVMLSLVKYDYRLINGRRYKFEKRFDILKRMPMIN